MQSVVKVTRRGQTTIPKELRDKFGIKEGDELMVEATEEGLLFKVVQKLEEMAGVDAGFGKVDAVKQKIDKLREEY